MECILSKYRLQEFILFNPEVLRLVFSRGLIQQSHWMWGASPARHGQQGFVTAGVNFVGLEGSEAEPVLTEHIPVPCSVTPKVSANVCFSSPETAPALG